MGAGLTVGVYPGHRDVLFLQTAGGGQQGLGQGLGAPHQVLLQVTDVLADVTQNRVHPQTLLESKKICEISKIHSWNQRKFVKFKNTFLESKKIRQIQKYIPGFKIIIYQDMEYNKLFKIKTIIVCLIEIETCRYLKEKSEPSSQFSKFIFSKIQTILF